MTIERYAGHGRDYKKGRGNRHMKIYLAHQISGLSYPEVERYYKTVSKTLQQMNFEVLHPMIGKGGLRTEKKLKPEGYQGHPLATNHAIYERDKWMVTQADIVYVNLEETQDVSIGMMMELAWASLLGKYTIVAMEPDNVHQHAFVLEAADLVLPDHFAVMNYLADFINGRI